MSAEKVEVNIATGLPKVNRGLIDKKAAVMYHGLASQHKRT